jgi:hypothetical protein
LHTQLVTYRFPPNTEFHVTERPPKVGDVLTRGGDEWKVVEVSTERDGHVSVTLRPRFDATVPAPESEATALQAEGPSVSDRLDSRSLPAD